MVHGQWLWACPPRTTAPTTPVQLLRLESDGWTARKRWPDSVGEPTPERSPVGRTNTLRHRSQRPWSDREPSLATSLSGGEDLQACPSYISRAIMNARMSEGRLAARTTHSRTAPSLPRTIASARIGEALFGRNDLQRQDRSQCPENDPRPTHGRSPVWRADPRRSYERSVSSRTPRVAARLGWSFLITP
jgi:hypothetical protein